MSDVEEESSKSWDNLWNNRRHENLRLDSPPKESLWSKVSEMVNAFHNGELPSSRAKGASESLQVGADCTLSPVTVPTQNLRDTSVITSSAGGGGRPANAQLIKRMLNNPDLQAVAVADSTNVVQQLYQCTLCDTSFESRQDLTTHIKIHSQESILDPYQCNYCGKTFAVPARLTRHYRTHTGEKPYQCEFCSKSFSVKENLSVHKRIHTKERPYKCDVCDRAFEHSGKLHRHMRIHTGERPHKCSYCDKTFIQSGQLVIHVRTHTGEKPYVCRICQKGFTCSKQLKVHTRTHTGEKPYPCDICGKSFGYNHVLKLHQVAHFGEKVYKCTLCKNTFTSKKTMESHIKMVHSEGNGGRENATVECSSTSSASDKENKLENSFSEDAKPTNIMEINLPSDCEIIPHPYHNPAQLQVTDQSMKYRTYTYIPPQPQPAHQNNNHNVAPVYATSPSSSDSSRSTLSPKMDTPYHSSPFSPSEENLYSSQEYYSSSPIPAMYSNGNARGNLSIQSVIMGSLASYDSAYAAPGERSSPTMPEDEPSDLSMAKKREVSSLPPRKRSKMILESMERDRSNLLLQNLQKTREESTHFRYNSVIQYAKAT